MVEPGNMDQVHMVRKVRRGRMVHKDHRVHKDHKVGKANFPIEIPGCKA